FSLLLVLFHFSRFAFVIHIALVFHFIFFFFFTDPSTTEIYTLSLHDALPIYATARLVTRLKTLFDQFWMVVYRQRPFSLTMISTTAAWRESVVYTGAEQPST